MKPRKPKSKRLPSQPAAWAKEVEKRVKAEGIELGHPQGKERFEAVTSRLFAFKVKADDKSKRSADSK
jgi:hypothetical protein